MFRNVLIVGCGGAMGALLRFLISNSIELSFPLATLLINIIGSFLLGLFTALLTRNQLSKQWMLFLGTGCCGGFTTFSTFAKEAVVLAQYSVPLFFTYVMLSMFFGLCAAWLGIRVGSKEVIK